MNKFTASLLSFFLPVAIIAQGNQFEIFGTIKGEYNTRVYLFYEGDYRHKDSISSEIKNGEFYFKEKASLPILGRLHLDQSSVIQDVYIDGNKIYIDCTNKYGITKNTNNGVDTMNNFFITVARGSVTETRKRDFETWVAALKNSNKPDEIKNQEYFSKLKDFIKRYPKNKAACYLLGKASLLSFSQITELNKLIDTSLSTCFEARSIRQLVNSLDKAPNRAIGNAFHNVSLPDTNNKQVNTTSFKGRYLLVEFWASWCGPCRKANPYWKELYAKYRSKGFEIVGVAYDADIEKWKKAIQKDGLSWPQVTDVKQSNGELGSYYDIGSLPNNILLDKEGKIVGVNLSTEEVENLLSKLL